MKFIKIYPIRTQVFRVEYQACTRSMHVGLLAEQQTHASRRLECSVEYESWTDAFGDFLTQLPSDTDAFSEQSEHLPNQILRAGADEIRTQSVKIVGADLLTKFHPNSVQI